MHTARTSEFIFGSGESDAAEKDRAGIFGVEYYTEEEGCTTGTVPVRTVTSKIV